MSDEALSFSYSGFIHSIWALWTNSWLHTIIAGLCLHLLALLSFYLWPQGTFDLIFWLKATLVFSFFVFGAMILLLVHAAVLEGESWRRFFQDEPQDVLIRHFITPLLYGFLVGFGFLLFILPGLYVLFAGMFFPIELQFDNKTPWQALRASFTASTGHVLRAIRIAVALFFLYLLCKSPLYVFNIQGIIFSMLNHLLEWAFMSLALIVYWQHYQWMRLLNKEMDNDDAAS